MAAVYKIIFVTKTAQTSKIQWCPLDSNCLIPFGCTKFANSFCVVQTENVLIQLRGPIERNKHIFYSQASMAHTAFYLNVIVVNTRCTRIQCRSSISTLRAKRYVIVVKATNTQKEKYVNSPSTTHASVIADNTTVDLFKTRYSSFYAVPFVLTI